MWVGLLAGAIALAITGCGPGERSSGEISPVAPSVDLREAPELAERVARGELPPLEKRLPEDPLVVDPIDEPGVYGGTWRRCHQSPDTPCLKMIVLYNPLVRWRPDCRGMAPGLASSWEPNEDATVFTFNLRRGVKWSDGEPYTADDFLFWWELCLDDRHFFEPPYWAYAKGEAMEVEAPDPYTMRLTFTAPNYFLPLNLASGFWWNEQYNIPSHYMKQFHPDHSSEHEDFVEFNKQNVVHSNPDRPTLGPWRLVSLGKASSRVTYERNPYYWVVDSKGRQLPYINRIESTFCQTPETLLLKATAGEVDCQFRLLQVDDAPLLLRFADKGGYQVRRWESGAGADPCVLVNWSPEDSTMRRLLRDKRLRRALSHAINRERINQVCWHGVGVPQNGTVSRQAWHFASPEGQALFDEWARSHASYDPDKAGRLLDELGFAERNGDGVRLWPHGEELKLVLDSDDSGRQNDVAVLIAEDWNSVGIHTIVYTPPAAERTNRHRFGKFTVSMSGTSEMDLFTYPDWVFPTRAQYWHPKVGLWYESGGDEGEPPTGPVAELVELYDACKIEPDLAARHQLVHEAVRIHIEEGPFYLGTCAAQPMLVVVKDNLRNVPETGILGPWAVGQPGSWFPEQFFLEDGANDGEAVAGAAGGGAP